uniref:Uncharacterized protein n=1 Tax=Parascaris equorum TaxID=6256 RepID=A0A914R7S9_PAREQ
MHSEPFKWNHYAGRWLVNWRHLRRTSYTARRWHLRGSKRKLKIESPSWTKNAEDVSVSSMSTTQVLSRISSVASIQWSN